MGIDAKMLLRIRRPVSDDEVRNWAREMCERFGAKRFFIRREKQQHALSKVEEFLQGGPTIRPAVGETFVEVNLWTRYYGPEYERGDLPLILNVAQWLEEVTGGEAWYGGDSSGVCARKLTRSLCAALWTHFRDNGHKPYTFQDRQDELRRHCDLCDWSMNRYGWGRDYAAYYCAGCGWRQITRDGGKTWSDKEAEGRLSEEA